MGIIPHEQLAVVYAAADVFVRPSLSEGLGSVFLEAMAARVPVVASAVGGIPDIVHDEQTGLVLQSTRRRRHRPRHRTRIGRPSIAGAHGSQCRADGP